MSNNKAYSLLEVKSFNDELQEIEGIASTISPDRVNDVVVPKGAQFKLPLPLLYQHDHNKPVGEVFEATVTDKGINIKARIFKMEGTTELANRLRDAWFSVKSGLVRGLSIGFGPLKYSPLPSGGLKFDTWDWRELSLVAIPANAEATITTVKSICDAEAKGALADNVAAAEQETPSPQKTVPGVTGIKSVKLTPATKEKETMNIAEQIKGFEEKRADDLKAMNAIMEKSAEEGRTLDETETQAYDDLEAAVKSVDGHLKRLKSMEASAAATAKPVEGSTAEKAAESRGDQPRITVKHNHAEKGLAMAQFVKTLGRAQGSIYGAHELAKSAGGSMDPRVEKALKAAVAAGTTANAAWAGNLVGEETSLYADFIEFLMPKTIIGAFGTGNIPSLRRVPFRVPLVGQTAGGTGYWVGEGKAKPLTQFAFSRTILEPFKVANIAVLTDEVLRNSNPAADVLVRDSLVNALRERLDLTFASADAATAVSPAGIYNGVTPIVSTGNPDLDIQAVLAQYIGANLTPTNAVWIMSTMTALVLSMRKGPLGNREYPELSMNGGTFGGFPVIVSEYADDTIALVKADEIYYGDEGGFAVDMSREASLEMSDTPLHNSDVPTAAQLVSMFQTNSVAFRAERYISWAKRRVAGVAYVTGVDYSESASV